MLPPPIAVPEGLHLPFCFVNLRGDRAVISGHPKQDAQGRIAGPFGQLGKDLTTAEGAEAARDIALSVLANLKAEIGDLSRVAGWVRVFGMVNSAPGYSEQHLVMNGFSDLIVRSSGRRWAARALGHRDGGPADELRHRGGGGGSDRSLSRNGKGRPVGRPFRIFASGRGRACQP
jgi:hypothetical protein